MRLRSPIPLYRTWRRREAITRWDTVWLVAAWAMLVAVMAVQQYLGPYVSLDLFYAAPIALAAWHRRRGIAFVVVWLALGIRTSGLMWQRWHAVEAFGFNGHQLEIAVNYVSALFIFVGVAWVVSALRASMDRERDEARRDSLTGLLNRRGFFERAEVERARLIRSRSALSVAFLDLDGFKGLNDSKGHDAGDTVLTQVARLLVTGTRSTDAVARVGGDEFALLLPDTEEGDAHELMRKLERSLAASAVGATGVTMSWGVSVSRNAATDLAVLLENADQGMYARKVARRGATTRSPA